MIIDLTSNHKRIKDACYVETLRYYNGIAYRHPLGLEVKMSGLFYEGKRWIRVTVANINNTLTYMDLLRIKDIFIGENCQAIQVFPSEEESPKLSGDYICLWNCLDGDNLPNFIQMW